MSLQAHLNDEAIELLPKIKKIISESEKFEANQMYNETIRKCCNASSVYGSCLVDMSENTKEEFQNDLIDAFKHFGWAI